MEGKVCKSRLMMAALVPLWAACQFDTSVQFDGLAGSDDPSDADAAVSETDGGRSEADAAPGSPDAAPAGTPLGTLLSYQRTDGITIDGVMDPAWQAHEFTTFAIADSEFLESVPGYTADAQVRMASQYDANLLYFFFEVHDDNLVDHGDAIYNDDSIEITIDGLGDRSGEYGMDDHWLVLGADSNYASLGDANIDIVGAFVHTDAGYNLEFTMQRSHIAPGMLTEFGFSVAINDDDDIGDTFVDAYGLWYLPEAPTTCEDCCASVSYPWCDTTRMGTLRLVSN